jgi:ABC-type proline/glycine betaine transport system permease subunit
MAEQPMSSLVALRRRPSDLPVFARASLAGPLWAAHHAMWGLFAAAAIAEATGLTVLLRALVREDGGRSAVLLGLALVIAARACVGLTASVIAARGERRRGSPVVPGGSTAALAGAAILVFSYGLTIYRFVANEPADFVVAFPRPAGLDASAAQAIDDAVSWAKRNWVDVFDAVTAALREGLNFIEIAFVQTPWPVVALAAMLAALVLSGWRAMLFSAACLAYLGLFGFWEKSMATMALIATSVIICVVLGLPLGILCAKSRRATAVLEPVLDVMQTLPTFVYLIPAVAFFSIGKPPGVIATVIFALPPIVRLTALGIRQVPPHVREAADAFGATPVQTLLKVELPLAVPSIRLGVNQTIMMCLSMVVVAAMIGAGGLGLDVIRSLQMLKTGQGFLAGLAIVLCAMMLDRMVRGRDRRPAGDAGR